jgi:hypothetical protein
MFRDALLAIPDLDPSSDQRPAHLLSLVAPLLAFSITLPSSIRIIIYTYQSALKQFHVWSTFRMLYLDQGVQVHLIGINHL